MQARLHGNMALDIPMRDILINDRFQHRLVADVVPCAMLD